MNASTKQYLARFAVVAGAAPILSIGVAVAVAPAAQAGPVPGPQVIKEMPKPPQPPAPKDLVNPEPPKPPKPAGPKDFAIPPAQPKPQPKPDSTPKPGIDQGSKHATQTSPKQSD
ncbi:MAG: hypothetical protein WA988_15065, partial [Candidatus Nanopelagicales bacterium]